MSTLPSTPKPTTPLTHEPTTPPVMTVLPYQPINIACAMFGANMKVTLWQESTPGTLVQRVPDGSSLILQGNLFTLTHGRPSDEGKYFCQATGSRKIPSVFVRYTPGRFCSLCDFCSCCFAPVRLAWRRDFPRALVNRKLFNLWPVEAKSRWHTLGLKCTFCQYLLF